MDKFIEKQLGRKMEKVYVYNEKEKDEKKENEEILELGKFKDEEIPELEEIKKEDDNKIKVSLNILSNLIVIYRFAKKYKEAEALEWFCLCKWSEQNGYSHNLDYNCEKALNMIFEFEKNHKWMIDLFGIEKENKEEIKEIKEEVIEIKN